jgi:hypothetical protein
MACSTCHSNSVRRSGILLVAKEGRQDVARCDFCQEYVDDATARLALHVADDEDMDRVYTVDVRLAVPVNVGTLARTREEFIQSVLEQVIEHLKLGLEAFPEGDLEDVYQVEAQVVWVDGVDGPGRCRTASSALQWLWKRVQWPSLS